MKIAFCTICSTAHVYLLRVLLKSIQINNPDLKVPFFVFCHMPNNVVPKKCLTIEDREELLRVCPDLTFVNIDPELYAEQGKAIQYYSLEAFGLEGFDRVVYWDADMLNVKPLDEMLKFPGDICMMKEKSRPTSHTYNNGGMMIDKKFLSQELRNKLIVFQQDRKFNAWGTDQALVVQYFFKHIVPMPQKFATLVTERDFIAKDEVVNWHYIIKPNCPDFVRRIGQDLLDLWKSYEEAIK
jgi:lipopolysaccharide biosynthesis glycosyltransferase